MHGGFIMARCEWPDLRGAIESQCGPLTDEGPVAQADWNRTPSGEDVFHVTSDGGRSYVLDPAMVLSSFADTIVALSGQLSCEVVGAGAETVSGSFWVTAAFEGRLALLHFDQKVAVTEPLHIGPRLPTEDTHPLDHPDGAGIFGAAAALGFSVPVLTEGTPGGGTRYRWESPRFPEGGPLDKRISEHCETHKRPGADDWMENVTVAERGNGYDVRGW